MKVKTRWHSTTDPEAKEKFKQLILQSQEVLDRLAEILEGMYESSLSNSENKATYNSPNWAALQADGIGERRTIQSLIDLVTLTEE